MNKIKAKSLYIIAIVVIFLLILISFYFLVFKNSSDNNLSANNLSSSSSSSNSSISSNSSSLISSSSADKTANSSTNSVVNLSNFEKLVGLTEPINKEQILITQKNAFNLNTYKQNTKFQNNNCKYFEDNPLIDDSDFELYKVSPSQKNQFILKIICNKAAYNSDSIFMYFEGSVNNPENISQISSYDYNKNKQVFEKINTENPAGQFLYSNVYNWDYLKFNTFYKARGIGDCGLFNLNQLVLEKKAIYTIKSQSQAECILEGKESNSLDSATKEKLKTENWPVEFDLTKN
jgi:hypothetical protein